ncbi:MAG: response regulator [Chloroflexi bacterium]|nr:response regulator [Anaerolineaceae bacterium]NMB88866.1 response regulator [Chloroflexota bacterium]
MATQEPVHTILVAEDDPDDQLLLRDALKATYLNSKMYFVQDGAELMDYLKHCGSFSDAALAPRPELILLDLNMPRKDGRQALKEIKNDPQLRRIPTIVMTTSSAESDVHHAYDNGTNAYIVKPEHFEELVTILQVLDRHWFQTVRTSGS